MFGRGHKNPIEKPGLSAATAISTIPEVFYGGNDPEAKYVSGQGGNTSALTYTKSVPESSSGRTKLIAAFMIIIFLAACAGAVWYYWTYLRSDAASIQTPPANLVVEKPAVEQVSVENTAPTTTAVETDTTQTGITIVTSSIVDSTIANLTLDFPSINQIDATDFDADGLTDAEEEVFGTDPSAFDTDKDEYYDGQEVGNLYNPKGLAPVRIIDSGLVREYVAPSDAYRIYYPIPWTVGTVDPAGETILITAANGDYLEIRKMVKQPGEDFTTWFGRTVPDQRITDLESGINRFTVPYLRRKDDLVAYIDRPNQVLVLIYHPTTSAPIAFRHIMRMALESVRVN